MGKEQRADRPSAMLLSRRELAELCRRCHWGALRATAPICRSAATSSASSISTPVDWNAAHPGMAVGQPQKATRKKGEAIFALWTDEIAGILRQIKRDRRTPAATRDYARKAHALRARKRR